LRGAGRRTEADNGVRQGDPGAIELNGRIQINQAEATLGRCTRKTGLEDRQHVRAPWSPAVTAASRRWNTVGKEICSRVECRYLRRVGRLVRCVAEEPGARKWINAPPVCFPRYVMREFQAATPFFVLDVKVGPCIPSLPSGIGVRHRASPPIPRPCGAGRPFTCRR